MSCAVRESRICTNTTDPAPSVERQATAHVYANYKINDKASLYGSYWYEAYNSQDWRLDGVQPATVYNLLAFGNQAPRYYQNVVQVSLRYRF